VTEERIAQIEQAIAELGPAYSQRAVYRKVGGSHDQLQAYLRAREATLPQAPSRRTSAPVDTQAVVAAMPAQAPSTLEEELQALTDAESAAEHRLSQLEELSQRQLLSESEEIYMVLLELRIGTLAVNIARAQ
jgi:hypothetical protein